MNVVSVFVQHKNVRAFKTAKAKSISSYRHKKYLINHKLKCITFIMYVAQWKYLL